jgi:hypothetical protein
MVAINTAGAAIAVLLAILSGWWLLTSEVADAFPRHGTDCSGVAAPGSAIRVFNDSVLALHNGAEEDAVGRALLLVVLGEVFDVSSGVRFYGRPPNAVLGKDAVGYNIFVGRDSSRAFATGDFVTPRSDLDGLTPSQVNSVVEWRTFYRNHKTYYFAGVHAGLYYSCSGDATDALTDIEAIARYAQDAAAAEAAMLAKFATCNSLYKPAEKFSEVSCPLSSTAVRVPRRLFWRSVASTAAHAMQTAASSTGYQQRCICITLDEEEDLRVNQPPVSVGGLRTERFEDCISSATSCRLRVN